MQRESLTVSLLLLAACRADPDVLNGDSYDPQLLEEYRRAIPDQSRLEAETPVAAGSTGALTAPGDAVMARQAVGLALAVNRPARQMVRLLREITDLPPTHFDASERRFVWGPWDHDQGVGRVSLMVEKNEPGSDFEYSYALVRSMAAELGDSVAVIAGGASPDAEDSQAGVGVSVWDLEMNHEFELRNDPAYVPGARGRGRFAMLYGHHEAEAGEAYFNLAVFRDFLPAPDDSATQPEAPLDVDYFYGRFVARDGMQVDFVDSQIEADLCDGSALTCFEADAVDDLEELFSYRAYFVDRGVGRAEARLSSGDLPGPVRLVECWDGSLDRTSFQVEADGAMVEMMSGGACASPTDQSSVELGLPTLDDVDAALMSAMTCAAENGIGGCD